MIFFTDLDGTVIRSASKKRAGDIAVEYKDGCEISCISSGSAKILAELPDLVIPVTSRSIEQYKRISIPEFTPKYALVSNGGNLLINGIPDENWLAWSIKTADDHREELTFCRDLLENDPDRNFEIRLVDGLFLFTKSNAPEKTLQYLNERLDKKTGLDLYNTGAKIYAVPKKLNKGAAVKRLVEKLDYRIEKIVCAGDSNMDISMLEFADISIYPDDIGLELHGFSCLREDFCEFVVKKAEELLADTQR